MTPTTTDDVLLAIQQTPRLTRLRRVSQAGAPSLFKTSRSVTRYEHSVGVTRLARRIGLPPEQQVIALLHDSTHSAFSHTLDYLTANRSENTHEHYATSLLDDPDLTAIVGNVGLARVVAAIARKPAWLGLLDAVDYTLRDLSRAGRLERSTAEMILRSLGTIDGQVCFNDTVAATTFTALMAEANQLLYLDQVDLSLHAALVALLSRTLDHGALSFPDLMTADDTTVLTTIASHPALRPALIDFLTLRPANLRERRDGCRITSKARLLDPPVLTSGSEVVALSELDPGWHRVRHAAERRADKGVRLLTTT